MHEETWIYVQYKSGDLLVLLAAGNNLYESDVDP